MFPSPIKKLRNNQLKVDSDMFYASLFEYNPDMVLFMDRYGVIAKVNKTFVTTLGYVHEEIQLSSFEKFIAERDISEYKKLFQLALTGEVQHASITLLHKSGSNLHTRLELIPAKSEDDVFGVFCIAKTVELEMLLADSKLKFLVDEAIVGVCIVQEDGNVIYGNERFHEILEIGDSPAGINIRDYIHPEEIPTIDFLRKYLVNAEKGSRHILRMVKADGTVLDIESHSAKIYLQNQPHVLVSLQELTDRERIKQLNEFLTYHDTLTGLPNKRNFDQSLEQQLLERKRSQQPLTVMFIDLDRFKYINESLGHSLGDQLINQVAERIQACLSEDAFLSRDGGDEFALYLPNVGNTQYVVEEANKLIASLEEPFQIEKYELYITASIGISIFPKDGEDVETLKKHADSALNKAKEKGKNTYQFFTTSMNKETHKIFTLESDLRKALDLGQFELYYQPQMNVITHEIVGAEALIRWNHPEWGMIYPNDFISLAEETGMILEIGKWVKETAIKQNKAWQDAGLPQIPITINLSAHRFLDDDLLMNIRNILAETQLDPKYLQIEIVETSLLENEKVVYSILQELKKIGVKIVLDDFGTGYSSLASLKQFKGWVDTLKLAQPFIQDLSRNDEDSYNYITKTMIDIAHHLEMNVVAEGVETVEQLEILNQYNCTNVQGYLFSKPVNAKEFSSLLKQGKIDPSTVNKRDLVLEQRRNCFRINLDFPLQAAMTLVQIHGRKVELGKTDVLIEDIGIGGLRFLSNIRLPVQPEVILEFETEILGNTVTMYGSVVWMKEVKGELFQYGLEFYIEESERAHLTKLLNKLAILLRKNPLVPDCSFVKVDRYSFFN